ncbi:P-selectin-like [Branchiostoma lanceolatum]|uniref:P-selectin-like n=1 Tax=Branchiostoma lanceolatum TaxID=7740 RepID=UPI003455D27E
MSPFTQKGSYKDPLLHSDDIVGIQALYGAPIRCPLLAAPTNGARTPSTGATSYQDTVTFTCDPGFEPDGTDAVTCQDDRQWSNPVPTCTRRQCPVLTAPTNGARTPSTGATSYQDTVTFTCDTGYVRNGADAVTCQADGTWINSVPTCTRHVFGGQCSVLTAPTNGARTPTTRARSYESVIKFTCDPGYVLNGASSVMCQADTSWTAPVPTCTRSPSTPPPKPSTPPLKPSTPPPKPSTPQPKPSTPQPKPSTSPLKPSTPPPKPSTPQPKPSTPPPELPSKLPLTSGVAVQYQPCAAIVVYAITSMVTILYTIL